MTAMRIFPGFAVPFAQVRVPRCEGLNTALAALFLARAKQGRDYANPRPYTQRNDALFESRFDLFQWPEPCIQQLREICFQATMHVVGELNNYPLERLRQLRMGADAWYHVTGRGGYFGLHNHPMASWSGVYCVASGEADPGQPSSGELSFTSPFAMNTMFVDAGTAQMRDPFTSGNRNFRLAAGDLLLFPSWLLHQVLPHDGPAERITVAFNAWFHEAAAGGA